MLVAMQLGSVSPREGGDAAQMRAAIGLVLVGVVSASASERNGFFNLGSASTAIKGAGLTSALPAGSTSKGSAPALTTMGQSMPQAPRTCCQICPQHFIMDLSLLEVSEHVKDAAYERFHRWHSAHKELGTPGFDAEVPSPDAWRAEPHPSSDRQAASRKLLGRQDPRVSAGPMPSYSQLTCCPLCPADFASPRDDVLMFVELDASASVEGRAERKSQFIGALSGLASAALPTLASTIGQITGKSTLKAAAAYSPQGVTCCDVCPSQAYPPTDASEAFTSFMQMAANAKAEDQFISSLMGAVSSSAKGVLPGGAPSSSATAPRPGGCCRMCASKFYGASEWGGTPFGEPGTRTQIQQSSGMQGYVRPRNPANFRTYA